MRILVTGGGCREPVDRVRALVNTSTGRTAALVAEEAVRRGHEVTALVGVAEVVPEGVEVVRFSRFAELAERLEGLLRRGDWDAVVHAAAVSDFSVAGVWEEEAREEEEGMLRVVLRRVEGGGKVDSARPVWVELARNEKLLARIKGWASGVGLVGFKLTVGARAEAVEEAVRRIFEEGADLVVHNDMEEMEKGVRARVFTAPGEAEEVSTTEALAKRLLDLLEERTLS